MHMLKADYNLVLHIMYNLYFSGKLN